MLFRVFLVLSITCSSPHLLSAQWDTQASGSNQWLYSVQFLDASEGWVVGNNGTILHTTDQGGNWNSVSSGTSEQLKDIHFIDTTMAWVVGENGTILHSSNGGSTWNDQSPGIAQDLEGVYFLNDSTGWAVGEYGTLLHTTDGGSNWNSISGVSGEHLSAVQFIDTATGWIVGQTVVLRTDDGGGTWDSISSGQNTNLNALHFLDSLKGWTVGYYGTVLFTQDGGYNWTAQSIGTTNDMFGVHFTDSLTGWVVGEGTDIYHTTDQGNTWNSQPSGMNGWLLSVHFPDSLRGWIVGQDGTILYNGCETTDNFNVTTCSNYTAPSGDTTYASSGIYEDTLVNSAGCDSILTIDLTVHDSSSGNISEQACNAYTVPSGDTTYTSSGTYIDTLTNNVGCDSLLTIDLTIKDSSSSTISPVSCDSYTVPSGDTTYASSGFYKDTLLNAVNCDSVITVDLTIHSAPDSSVTVSGTTISALVSGVQYQWLDCSNGYQPISGETGSSYTATSNGDYAVEVTENGCSDTSRCVTITTVGIQENSLIEEVDLYPNPTKGRFFLDLGTIRSVELSIRSIEGRLLREKKLTGKEHSLSLKGMDRGVYFVKLKSRYGTSLYKVVKE